jgi:hypothetical protein
MGMSRAFNREGRKEFAEHAKKSTIGGFYDHQRFYRFSAFSLTGFLCVLRVPFASFAVKSFRPDFS